MIHVFPFFSKWLTTGVFVPQEGHVFQEGRKAHQMRAFRVEVVFFLPRPSETYVALPAVVLVWSKSRMDFPLKTAATRKGKTLSFLRNSGGSMIKMISN